MPTLSVLNNATVVPFAGGISGTPSQNLVNRVVFSGAWKPNDVFQFNLVTSGQILAAGVSYISQTKPVYAVTLNDRVHFVADSTWYGSDNGSATNFARQYPGSFFIDISNQWQEPEPLVSLAPYQGSMAVFSNRTIQIWVLDPNPLNIAPKQVLSNIGSYCPLGPQSIGDLDVIFPSTTGLRSLRVRDASLNAFVNDIGSPIDKNIQDAILSVGNANLLNTCSIVEPSANRYWHFINGKIFVLSYFPAAQINAAWSQYWPTDDKKQAFTPVKFITYRSLVYLRGKQGNKECFFVYGGLNGAVYDDSTVVVATAWLDLKAPVNRKNAEQLDYVIQGSWQFFGSMDWQGVANGAALQAITSVPVTAPSFQNGQVGWSDDGFHVKLQAQSSGNALCVLSSLIFSFQKGKEK